MKSQHRYSIVDLIVKAKKKEKEKEKNRRPKQSQHTKNELKFKMNETIRTNCCQWFIVLLISVELVALTVNFYRISLEMAHWHDRL